MEQPDNITYLLKVAAVGSLATAALIELQSVSGKHKPAIKSSIKLVRYSLSLAMNSLYRDLGLETPVHKKPKRKKRKRKRRAKKKINGYDRLKATKPVQLNDSTDWDPESPHRIACYRVLLLEVIKRAAHDWVLYRQHTKLENKELAEDAYVWLFEEEPGHPQWKERAAVQMELSDGRVINGARVFTSFLSICEALGLDPDTVRGHVRKLDIKTITSSGRPASRRRPRLAEAPEQEHGLTADVDVEAHLANDNYESEYEKIAYVPTLGFK